MPRSLSRRHAAPVLTLLVLCLLGGPEPCGATEPIVRVGAGSYTTTRPSTCEPLPSEVSRVARLSGPVPTSDWWSSLAWKRYSQPMFAHPLAITTGPGGVSLTYPGDAIQASATAIMSGAPDGDLTVALAGDERFPSALYAGSSDWFVTAELRTSTGALRASFGHGSPFVYLTHDDAAPVVRFKEAPQVWAGSLGDAAIGVTVRGRHYGLFAPSDAAWRAQDDGTWTIEQGAGYLSIALLPDRAAPTFELFRACAHRHVTDTRATFRVDGGHIETTFQLTTVAKEGDDGDTLTSLYPHQWKHTADPLLPLAYRSVRGDMKLRAGDSFVTRVPIQGVLPHLPGEAVRDRARLVEHLRESPRRRRGARDTYWDGKYLGVLATLAGVAESIGEQELRRESLETIRTSLENWLTAGPGETSPLFYYDRTWGTLVGSEPSYGSDLHLNDHHFHYGYFIRAAAEVARHDPSWIDDWGPMVDLLIRDIATPDRDDELFPHLRCFDVYAGHAWASGRADYPDGNNQESSSESMNAWYGMILWGEVTGNTAIRDTGLFLFNTERTAIDEYWFDVDNEHFPPDFPEVALGIVWGGKGDHATWFSPDVDCIHGINWLPITPASLYLGRSPSYVRTNHDRVIAKRAGADDYNTGWGDLLAMYGALADGERSAAYIDANPDCRIEHGNARAFMSQWCHTLARYGQVDASVTADHPYVAVFQKDGVRTRVVYHFGEEPIDVRFSDGVTVRALGGMTVVTDER